MAGPLKEQVVEEIIVEYSASLDLIDSSSLLLTQQEAPSQETQSKEQHLLSAIHVPRRVLHAVNDKTVQTLGDGSF